jgi:hypothetical protein
MLRIITLASNAGRLLCEEVHSSQDGRFSLLFFLLLIKFTKLKRKTKSTISDSFFFPLDDCKQKMNNFQNALTTSPHDVLDVATKLTVLSAIQHDLASHHGKAAFVLSVLVSWLTTLHVSWVSGGFAGGAAVVLLSDRTSALVLLAGSKYGGGAVGAGSSGSGPMTTSSGQANGTGSSNAAAVVASSSMSFRVVAVVCASEVMAHSYVAPEHLRACLRATTNHNASSGGGGGASGSSSAVPPPAAVAMPRFSSVSLAFCTILERARYVLIERSPPAALARMFHDVGSKSTTLNADVTETRLAVPLGSLTSLAVAMAATIGADDTIIAPAEGSQLSLGGVSVQFPSLSAFRVAALARVSRTGTVMFASALRHKRDFSALSTSAAGLETLWCLAGCRMVHFSADVNIKAATFREITTAASISAGDPADGGSGGGGASSSSPSQKGTPRNNIAAPSTSGVFPPGGGGQSAPQHSTSVAAAPQQLDTKERTIAVTEGAIVLLKKKSAFPPPLWCTAVSWNLVSRLILHTNTFRSIGGAVDDEQMPPTAAAAPSVAASKEPETAPLSVTIVVRTRSTWGVEEFNGTLSATSSAGDVEEVFSVGFTAMPMLVAFIFACRDSYSEFTNGKVLPVLPQGAEFQTLWIPIPVRPDADASAIPARPAASARTPSPKKKSLKSSAPPPPTTASAAANNIRPAGAAAATTPMCMMWPLGSDVDTPRRYPQQLFTIGQLSSASSVVANSTKALSSLDLLLTETPAAFIMAVQYVFLSNAPRTFSEASAFETGGNSVVVEALPSVLHSDASAAPSLSAADGVGRVRWAASSKPLPGQEDAFPLDEEEDRNARSLDAEAEEPVMSAERTSMLPLMAPVMSAIASSVVMHFAHLPSVMIGSVFQAPTASGSASRLQLLPGRLSDILLAAVAFDTCLRSAALRPTALFPIMSTDALEHMMRRFGLPSGGPLGSGGTLATSFAFLVCRWVVATSLRDMFLSLRRWVTSAHQRHVNEQPSPTSSPRGNSVGREANADDAERVRSFSAFPDAPQPHEGSMRRLSSAKVASPLSSSKRGVEPQRRRLDAGDWRSTANSVGLDPDGVPLNPADVLRMFVHRLTSGAAFNMLQGGSSGTAKDHQTIMKDAAMYRDVWRPRMLAIVDLMQSTLHATTSSSLAPSVSAGQSGTTAGRQQAAVSLGASTTAAKMFTVILLDVLMDLSIHHHAAVNHFYSGDATTTAFEYSANVLRHGLLRPAASGAGAAVGSMPVRGGGSALHPVAKQIAECERSVVEWLRKDAPPVANLSAAAASPAASQEPTNSPSSPLNHRSVSSTRNPPTNTVVSGDVVSSTRSDTFSLRSLMQKVQSIDEHLLATTYRVTKTMSSSIAGHETTTSTSAEGPTIGMWDIFVGHHVAFRWAPASTTAAAALDMAPLTRLHRYFSSGVPGSGGTLWHELFQALTSAPMSMGALQQLSQQIALTAIGHHARDALLLRRDVSTQTLRTSTQEAKLLEDHLSLRSQVLLSPSSITGTDPRRSPLLTGSDGGGVRSPPPLSSLLNTPTNRIVPILARPPSALIEDDNDIETNKNLMRRVLKLEGQLLDAHERNADLQRLLTSALQQQTDVAASHAAAWDKKLLAHASKAQAELQRERLLFVVEKEAGQREVAVNREAREWFELTSGLLLTMMLDDQRQRDVASEVKRKSLKHSSGTSKKKSA